MLLKKILAIVMFCFFIFITGCSSKSNDLVRTMKNNETAENLNTTLKGTEIIVEDSSGKFNELCATMEESIVNYDNLYKEVEGYVVTLENNSDIKKDELQSIMSKITNDQNTCSGKRKGIYTYNKNFNEYWDNLMDSYNCLKDAIINMNDLKGKGTVEKSRKCLETSKNRFEVVSNVRGELKKNILKQDSKTVVSDENNGSIKSKNASKTDKLDSTTIEANYKKTIKDQFPEVLSIGIDLSSEPHTVKIAVNYQGDSSKTMKNMAEIQVFSERFFKAQKIEYLYFDAIENKTIDKGSLNFHFENNKYEMKDITLK